MNIAKVHSMQQARQAHEDPLNLRSLPLVAPTEDDWPPIEAALIEQGRKRRIVRYAGTTAAIAATIALAAGLVLQFPSIGPAAGPAGISGEPPVAAAQGQSQSEVPGTVATPPAASEGTLGSLIALSQQLEGSLRVYRSKVGDLPAGSLVYQVELQDLVVQVDEELSMHPDSLELWSHRVNLLLDLSRLYENSLRRDYHLMASL